MDTFGPSLVMVPLGMKLLKKQKLPFHLTPTYFLLQNGHYLDPSLSLSLSLSLSFSLTHIYTPFTNHFLKKSILLFLVSVCINFNDYPHISETFT